MPSTAVTLISGITSNTAAYLRSGAGPHRQRLDARVRRGCQLFLAESLRERAAHQVADDLGVHLVTELLPHHRVAGPFQDGSPSGGQYGKSV